MKTKAITLACILTAGAALLTTPSCHYLECLTSGNMEECLIGKGMEQVVGYLADAKNLNSAEEAEKFASRWSKIQTTISTAQSLGVKVPDGVKKTYNDTLTRIIKHKYFNSPTLQTAMADAQYIK